MYIRRKVYSDYTPVNETYLDEERIYSVNMTESDLMLFSDFCDELERLYSDEEESLSTAQKIGIGAGAAIGAAGLTAAGIYGHKKGWFKGAKRVAAEAAKAKSDAAKEAYKAGKTNLKLNHQDRKLIMGKDGKAVSVKNLEDLAKEGKISPNKLNDLKTKATELKRVQGERANRQLGMNNLSSGLDDGVSMSQLRKQHAKAWKTGSTKLKFNDWVQSISGARAYSDIYDDLDFGYYC